MKLHFGYAMTRFLIAKDHSTEYISVSNSAAAYARLSRGSELAAKTLHCYAEGRDGDWEAICLDLDIAVQGRSFEEVFASLQEAIALYLESVADLPEDERRRLLQHTVPLATRLKLLWQAARGLLSRAGGQTHHHQFTMPLAA